jgi:CIC family chloride channel protein
MQFPPFRQLSRLLGRRNVQLTDAFYLNLLAVCVGMLVGLFVFLFKGGINWASALIRGDGPGQQLELFADYRWLIYLLPPLGGLAVGFIFRLWGRHRRFRGVSVVLESVARRGGRMSLRKSGIELLNSALTIISGMSVGMEGPIVVGGSTIGSRFSDVFQLSATRRRTLLASGAAAGISAVFNAPIAGFFFALELILGDFSKKAVAAIVLASVSSNVTLIALTGGERVFELPHYGLISLAEMVNYVVLGLICGLVAYSFAQVLQFCDTVFPNWRIYPPLKPMVGGLLVAALALFFPEILGTGHATVERLVNGHYPLQQHLFPALTWGSPLLYLLILAFAKLVATSITLGSGAAGGKFMPSLFMGASVGGVFGVAVNNLGWITTEAPAAYALVGMAAIFGSIAQAPLTVILLVFEMTGNYTVILPMMAAGVVSQVVFYSLRKDGVFTHKLARMGIKFGRGKDLNILEAIPVSRAMHKGVETIDADDSFAQVRERFARTQHHGFPVVDANGRLLGMLTTSDLAKHMDSDTEVTAQEICTLNVFAVDEDDNCHKAIALLEDHHIGRVPVVDSAGHPVGIITRTDIVGAYKLALQIREQELEEQGG